MAATEMTVTRNDALASSRTGVVGRAPHSHYRRAAFVRWVRKTHGWFGLWGALLGLIFGVSGFWLNHRAVLKLPPMAQQRINAQLVLPDPAPASARAMAVWLQDTLGLDRAPNAVRIEPAKVVAWAKDLEQGAGATAGAQRNAALVQPERWTFNFGGPHAIVQAEYWRGNRSVGVTTTRNGFIATLTNLHKGVGMSPGWILLIDTLAGSLVFLSLSGVILWVETSRRRFAGVMIFGASVAVTLGLMLPRL